MTDFRIGVDWRRKGYICRDARPGDPLNVLPTPITSYASIDYSNDSGSISNRQEIDCQSPDGRFGCVGYHIQTGTGLQSRILINQ